MENKLIVTTCEITFGEKIVTKCNTKQITQQQLDSYAEQLKDYLLKVDCSKTRSYDNSDDDRVISSYNSWKTTDYYEIDAQKNSEYLVVDGDTVIGVVFHISTRNSTEKHVFLFDGSIQETMRMGYSASHSSEWTYVEKVTLVKRNADGAPQEGRRIYFSQSEMSPSF